jgi:hypothetical protein
MRLQKKFEMIQSHFPLIIFLLLISSTGMNLAAHADEQVCPYLEPKNTPKNLVKMVAKHREDIRTGKIPAPREVPMVFEGGPADKDLYNSPGEFQTIYQGKKVTLFAGREESEDSETDMRVAFYQKKNGKYIYLNDDPDVPNLKLQDPAIMMLETEYGNELILCGVNVWVDGHTPEGKEKLNYATHFYRDYGKGFTHLKKFLVGPDHMKDIRIVQDPDKMRLPGDGFDVLTRPQDEKYAKGGRGQVGILHVNSLEEITAEKIANAPIIPGQFLRKQWGGGNWAKYIDRHIIGVVGHYARYVNETLKDEVRDYVGVDWKIDTRTNRVFDAEVAVERADLVKTINLGAKRSSLENVVFPSGVIDNYDGTLTYFVGVGDKFTVKVIVRNPFWKFKNSQSAPQKNPH